MFKWIDFLDNNKGNSKDKYTCECGNTDKVFMFNLDDEIHVMCEKHFLEVLNNENNR